MNGTESSEILISPREDKIVTLQDFNNLFTLAWLESVLNLHTHGPQIDIFVERGSVYFPESGNVDIEGIKRTFPPAEETLRLLKQWRIRAFPVRMFDNLHGLSHDTETVEIAQQLPASAGNPQKYLLDLNESEAEGLAWKIVKKMTNGR